MQSFGHRIKASHLVLVVKWIMEKMGVSDHFSMDDRHVLQRAVIG